MLVRVEECGWWRLAALLLRLPIYAPVLGVFDDALVAATAKFKCRVTLGEYEWPIHEHIDVGEGLRQGRCF